MVAGLAFLSKKSFNPANLSNQKSVWQAEQESLKEQQRLREREKQLRIERDHEELARIRDGSKGGNMATLRFMYDAPPGLDSKKERKESNYDEGDEGGLMFERSGEKKGGEGGSQSHAGIGFERCDGDDDAAAEFRRLLNSKNGGAEESASAATASTGTAVPFESESHTASSSLVFTGSTAEATQDDKSKLTQLEKAVGKRNAGSGALTYEEQVARFPQLKNAPMALKRKGDGGEDVMDTNVTFKPLGAQIRNVRCLKCGLWGHSRGDRECKLSGWDPFASVTSSAPASSIIPPPAKRHSSPKDGNGNDGEYQRELERRKKSSRRQVKDEWDSDDSTQRGRERHRRKKSKRRHRHEKESKRDRKERKRRKKERSRHRDDRSYGSDSEGSYSSYEERRRHRKRKDDRRKHKKSRRRSPSYDSSRSR